MIAWRERREQFSTEDLHCGDGRLDSGIGRLATSSSMISIGGMAAE